MTDPERQSISGDHPVMNRAFVAHRGNPEHPVSGEFLPVEGLRKEEF